MLKTNIAEIVTFDRLPPFVKIGTILNAVASVASVQLKSSKAPDGFSQLTFSRLVFRRRDFGAKVATPATFTAAHFLFMLLCKGFLECRH